MSTTLPLNLPPTEAELFGHTTCGYVRCSNSGTTFPQREAIIGCIRVHTVTHQEHFCSFTCRDKWLKQMQGAQQ